MVINELGVTRRDMTKEHCIFDKTFRHKGALVEQEMPPFPKYLG
jgi:hypothetical protein